MLKLVLVSVLFLSIFYSVLGTGVLTTSSSNTNGTILEDWDSWLDPTPVYGDSPLTPLFEYWASAPGGYYIKLNITQYKRWIINDAYLSMYYGDYRNGLMIRNATISKIENYSWTEHNNSIAPVPLTDIVSTQEITIQNIGGKWINFSITSWINNQTLSAKNNLSFHIILNGTITQNKFNTKESTTNRPMLTLNYSVTYPTMYLITPINNTYTNNNNINFSCNATMSTGEFFVQNITLWHNITSTFIGNFTNTTSENLSGYLGYSLTNVNDGKYAWNCKGVSNLSIEQIYDTNWTFTIDTLLPVPSFVTPNTPLNGTFRNKNATLINITYTDVNPYAALLDWNGTNYTMTCTGVDCFFNKTGLSDARYYYQAWVYDITNNTNGTGKQYVTIDTKKPVPIWKSPIYLNNNTWATGNSWYMNISYTEVNLNTAWLDWNGTNNTMTCTAGGCYFNKTDIADGSYYYKASMSDNATNSNETGRYWVRVDTTLPVLDYIPPTLANNSGTSLSPYLVNISYTESNFQSAIIDVDGSQNGMTCTSNSCWYNIYTTGEIHYNVTISDLAGNYNYTLTRIINIDTSPPSVTIIRPQATTYSSNTSLPLNWSVVDTNLRTVWYNLDNGANTTITTNVTFNTTAGAHTLYLFANDSAGNIGWDMVSFTVSTDSQSPTVVLNYPSNGTWASNNSVMFNYTATDTNLAYCELRGDFDGTYQSNQTNIAPVSGVMQNWSLIVLNDGSTYHWNVWCNDSSNNVATATSNFTLYIDTIYPLIEFSSPTMGNNSFIKVDSYFVNISYAETNRASTLLDWNGANQSMTCSSDNSCYYNKTGIIDGNYYYKVFMNDLAGNVNITGRRYVTIDTAAPSVTIQRPESKVYITNTSLALNWSVVDNNQGTVWYNIDNGVNITLTTNTTFNISDGNHILTVFANDSAANLGSASVSFTVTVDSGNPSIALNFPGNGTWLNFNSVILTTTSADANLATCKLYGDFDGVNFAMNQTNITPANNTAMNWSAITLDSGTYHWNVWCNDSSNNVAMSISNFTFYVDSINPQLYYNSQTLSNASFRNVNSYQVVFNITDSNVYGAKLDWNGANSTCTIITDSTPNWCAVNKTGLSDGYYYYTGYVNDYAGNFNVTGRRYITIDATPPTVTIIRPEAITYSVTNLSLNWSVVDTNQGTVWYNLDNGANITLTTNTTINVTSGAHTLYLFANDSAGNINMQSVSFTASTDQQAPITTLNYPSNGTWASNNSVMFNYTATDTNLAYCELRGDFDGTYKTNQTNIAPVSGVMQNWSLMVLNDGTYHWSVWCNDSFSNGAPALFNNTIFIDTILPVLDFDSAMLSNNSQVGVTSLFVNVSYTETNRASTLLDWNGANQSMTCGTGGCYFNKTGLVDSVYYYKVFMDDSVGNMNVTQKRYVTIDTTYPNIAYSTPTQATNTYSSVNSYFINVSYIEVNRAATLLGWNGVNETMTCGTGGCYVNKTGLADAVYTYYAFMNDTTAHGNVTEVRNIVIDTTPPVFSGYVYSPSVVYNNYTLELNFTLTESNVNTVWIETNVSGSWSNTTLANLSTVYSFEIGIGLLSVHKNITYRYHANDSAGNENLSDWLTVYVQNRAPTTPTLVTSNGTGTLVYSKVLNYTSTDADGDSLMYYLWQGNGSFIGNSTVGFNWTGLDSEGVYNWNVFASDYMGNSSRTDNQTMFVDFTVPAILVTEPVNESTLAVLSNSLIYSVSDTMNLQYCWYNLVYASTLAYAIGNTTLAVCNASTTSVTYVLPQMSATYLLRFYANDSAGNVNSTSRQFSASSGAGNTGGAAAPRILNYTTYVYTPAVNMTQQYCDNDGVCDAGIEDAFSCSKDCPANISNLLMVLKTAWFAKLAFLFIVVGFLVMILSEQNKNGKSKNKLFRGFGR